MESSNTAKAFHTGRVILLLVAAWLVILVGSVQWGIGNPSTNISLGGGIIPIVFAIVLRGETGFSKTASSNEKDAHKTTRTRISLLTGSMIGAGLVLLIQSLVRMIVDSSR